MQAQAIQHFQYKLDHEMDSSDLFKALEAGECITVLDTRTEAAYGAEHIPMAESFPHREMSEATLARLDKAVLYVTYCDGIGCNASTKGALHLAKHGFRVKELMGGLDWWKRDGYATKGTMATPGNEIGCAC